MTVSDFRRFRCDSCTKSFDMPLASLTTATRPIPEGWVEALLGNSRHGNHERWWCPECVSRITSILPNALGELATGWPRVKQEYCDRGPCCLEGGHEGACKQ